MDAVFQTITELGLPLQPDADNAGGGNCFFFSLVQQTKRKELELCPTDHLSLRRDVCKFAQTDKNNETMKKLKLGYNDFVDANGGDDWDTFFKKMSRSRVWVEYPLTHVAAYYLQRDMIIVFA